MQAYYDEKLKVWVFPGEDPEEKAKPIGPPPTAAVTPQGSSSSPLAPAAPSDDPLAAMMAPPQRPPSALRARSTPNRFPTKSLSPSSSLGSAPKVTTPHFAVFQPKPADLQPESLEGANSQDKKRSEDNRS